MSRDCEDDGKLHAWKHAVQPFFFLFLLFVVYPNRFWHKNAVIYMRIIFDVYFGYLSLQYCPALSVRLVVDTTDTNNVARARPQVYEQKNGLNTS